MKKIWFLYKIYDVKTLDDVIEFHGHVCPGLAMGYRVSMFALKELGERAEDEEVVAIVENDSCAVDAVQVMLGCTFGKGNLIFRDYGKQVYTFVKRQTGEAVRVSVKWVSPDETEEEKAAWERYMEGDHSEAILRIVHSRKSKKTEAILKARDEELFDVTRLKMHVPKETKIYPSARCAICGEKVMEPKTRIKDGKVICIPCFKGSAAPAEL
jgi:formylmethanofuran dehydrogenase subunit E